MPNWKEVLQEIADESKANPNSQINPIDVVRRKYLLQLSEHSGRNVIAYYSGWLQKRGNIDASVNDKDISGFMLNINKLDKKKGLDLILHTPGGDIAATETLVHYLKSVFGNNIRAIIPQLSMSAGTMIALSVSEIIMGKHSSLGPIDPQIGGMPAESIIKEFDQARKEILANPKAAGLWQFIISKYHPTLLNSCKHAIDMSKSLVKMWLKENMCQTENGKINKIVKEFSSHTLTKMHARHISNEKCKEIGLNITDLEKDDKFQDLVLTVHHAFMHTFSKTNAVKVIENQNGIAYIESVPMIPMPQNIAPRQVILEQPIINK